MQCSVPSESAPGILGVGGLPTQPILYDLDELPALKRCQVVLNHLLGHTQEVVALPVLDQVEALQGAGQVLHADGCLLVDVLQAEVALILIQDLQRLAQPV